MSPPIVTDVSSYPVVIQRWLRAPTDDELLHHLHENERLLQGARLRLESYVLIVTGELSATPKQRQIIAQWMDSQGADEVVLGAFIVAPSRIMRGLITALSWLTSHGDTLRVFGSESEARVAAKAAIDACAKRR